MSLPFFPLPFLPLLFPAATVNLHHVFFNGQREGERKKRALVEACEPDTTVNLHFHSVTLSPLLLILFFFFFIGTSHIGQAGNYTELS